MAAAVNATSTDVKRLIEQYKAERDAFDIAVKDNSFLKERSALREVYANARVTIEALNDCLSSITNTDVKKEMKNRFNEWDKKIKLGKLKPSQEQPLLLGELIQKVNEFVTKHSAFMTSDPFKKFFMSKSALRESFINYVQDKMQKKISKENAIEAFKIEYKTFINNDPEILNRIDKEWSWKV
jgi:hypothetical protein